MLLINLKKINEIKKYVKKKRRKNIDYGSQYIFKKDFGNVLKSLNKEKITSGGRS